MPLKLELTGHRFGRLVALAIAPAQKSGTAWRVKCDCGREKIVLTSALRSGNTKACGCLVREGNSRTHGEAYKTAEYRTWMGMKSRAKHSDGRIEVCASWLGSYEQFLADMGRKPTSAHSLDRIDSQGHYEPSNCRWATKVQQARNTKANHLVEYKGQTKCVTEWALEFGLNPKTLSARLSTYGWSIEQALRTQPKYNLTVSRKKIHGETAGGKRSPEYSLWKQMRNRCSNPKNQNFVEYGARGIKVCAEWETFLPFLKDIGRRPSPKHSLDRINPNGNYEPENCRWVTSGVQQRNRRNTVRLTLGGVTLGLQDWAEYLGLAAGTVRARLQRGWSHERALTEKIRSIS